MTFRNILILMHFLLLSCNTFSSSREEAVLKNKIIKAELQVQNEEFINKFNKFASTSKVKELPVELHFLIYAIWDFNEDGSFYVISPTFAVMPSYIGIWKPLENGKIELEFKDPGINWKPLGNGKFELEIKEQNKKLSNKNFLGLKKPKNFKKILITKMRLSDVTKINTSHKNIVPFVKMEIEQIE